MRYAWRLLASCTILLAGCSVGPTRTAAPPVTAPVPAAKMSLQGRVHGGQQPINGASVYLFALATSGYGNASSSLLLSTVGTPPDASGRYFVTTNATGGFTITATDYACTPGQQVYLYSVGGDAGFGTNTAAAMMAVLGQCGAANSFTNLPAVVQMNEVTTVAAAYALAGFAADATDMSGSSTPLAATGMANAALGAANLVSIATGQALALTPAGNGEVPGPMINTLADILAACVNSSGSGSAGCTTLFQNATSNGTPPMETATAAINIAHNPAGNAALFDLATPDAPFQPIYTPYKGSGPPNDWTLTIVYTGGGLDYPAAMQVDGSGDVWVKNTNGNSLTEFSPTGVALSPPTGYTGGGLDGPAGLAIDQSGNLWTANQSASPPTLSEFTSSGMPVTGSPFSGGGLNDPYAVAVDGQGNVWVVNWTNSLSEFTSAGVPITVDGGYSGGGLNESCCLAIDPSGNVWVANVGGSSVSAFSSLGQGYTELGFTGGGIDIPQSIAIDGAGNVWVSDGGGVALSEFTGPNIECTPACTARGTPLSPDSGYTGGGLVHSNTVEIDGAGNVWALNANNPAISEFDSQGTPITGSSGYVGSFQGTVTPGIIGGDPQGLAIDLSGNVWVSDPWLDGPGGTDNVVEFVGAGTPVVTPISVGVTTNQLGTRP